MEPKVIIIEINSIGVYKIFSSGTSFIECRKEEVLQHLSGKLHMFILISSNIDKMSAHKISSFFFKSSEIESMSVMYSSVAVSLALGLQNVSVVSIDHSPGDSVQWSADLVQKSSLNYAHSMAGVSAYEAALEQIMERLHSSVYKNATSSLFIKGNEALSERVLQELKKKGMILEEEESSLEDMQVCGYKLACFPKYFSQHMPHSMLPNSDIVYVGAVLTIMINYFEIKEVNTREDFEAGHTKHLLLN